MSSDPALLFEAFADPTRLRLLHLLHRAGERCVCDLQAAVGLPQAKVSRHLGVLRQAGLVTARRDGRWMHYTLGPAQSALHRSLLSCLDCCFDQVPQMSRDLQRLGVGAEGGCRGAGTACGPVEMGSLSRRSG